MWLGCLGVALLCTGSGGGVDAKVFAVLAAVLVGAKLVGDLFERIGQPAVLGELFAGILLGNLSLVGIDSLAWVPSDPNLLLLAEIGVVLLLFEVGLESDLVEMARVGLAAIAVAIAGVVAPVALGYGVHALFAPEQPWYVHLFVGAVLAATSVGITARVLKDMGKIATPTARVVLGAAVIDDVLGLIVLAVVVGLVQGATGDTPLAATDIVWIIVKAVAFLGGAIVLGRPLSRAMFRAACYLRSRHVLLPLALAFCFALSYAAKAMGLATIVGAFAAGLVLDALIYKDIETREMHGLEVQLHPITNFLVPLFFVVTGAQVQLGALNSVNILLLALALTVAAIVGKQVCSLVAFGPGVNKLAVGLGMIPRGEVGLIFALEGRKLGANVIDDATYAAIVVMVMITTMITPPVLAAVLKRETDESQPSPT